MEGLRGRGLQLAECHPTVDVGLEQGADLVACDGGLPVERRQLEDALLVPGRQQAEEVAVTCPRLLGH